MSNLFLFHTLIIIIIIHDREVSAPHHFLLCVSNKSLRFGLSRQPSPYIVFREILPRDEMPPAYQSTVCSGDSEFKQCENSERKAARSLPSVLFYSRVNCSVNVSKDLFTRLSLECVTIKRICEMNKL